LTTVNGDCEIEYCGASLNLLTFPSLTTITGLLDFEGNQALQTISLPILINTGAINLTGNLIMTALNLPLLQSVAKFIYVQGNPTLLTLSFPSLITVSNLLITDGYVQNLNFPMLAQISGDFNISSNVQLNSFRFCKAPSVNGKINGQPNFNSAVCCEFTNYLFSSTSNNCQSGCFKPTLPANATEGQTLTILLTKNAYIPVTINIYYDPNYFSWPLQNFTLQPTDSVLTTLLNVLNANITSNVITAIVIQSTLDNCVSRIDTFATNLVNPIPSDSGLLAKIGLEQKQVLIALTSIICIVLVIGGGVCIYLKKRRRKFI